MGWFVSESVRGSHRRVAIDDLDDFLALVSTREQDQITRLTVVSMSGRKQIVTVQPEYNFWPTFEVNHDKDAGWQRIEHSVVLTQ